ncbi:DUF7322 domain-containing protein [Haloarcula litorea]|uniref:DUF7322 domain-containing protein n=1 Tax=Haloarcula litorea TaxID=3032579 RepID=UPI0023E88D2D|nr:hypothetical protein [Halomicroarcula sp. GDY20]
MTDGLDDVDPDEGGGVLSEKSPHEPEEFDPDSLGPDVPEAPSPPSGTPDDAVAGLFWKLVVVFNVALLALALGPMLAFLDGRVDLGVRVFLVGVLAFGYGTYRYVRFRRDRDGESDEGDPDAPGAEGSAGESPSAESDHNG